MSEKIYVVGIGPGSREGMTLEAQQVLHRADVIVGYPVYLALLGEEYADKKMLSTPMRREEERCRMAFEEAHKGNRVALVCSGDAGVYGMASLMYSIAGEYPAAEVEIICGVTAALSGAARLGAPLTHDFAVISLSDLLTPWELIEKRLRAAATADFAMAIYNPASHKRPEHLKRACDILLETIDGNRVCGYVENIGRQGEKSVLLRLDELRNRELNMFTTVFIGNSSTAIINGKMVTKRGYHIE